MREYGEYNPFLNLSKVMRERERECVREGGERERGGLFCFVTLVL